MSQKIFIDKISIMLRHHREASGMGQSEMADQLKVGLRSYQRYEAGESVPSIDLIYSISKILQFELKDFFAAHELKENIPGFKIFPFDTESKNEHSVIIKSDLITFFGSPEFKRVLDSGNIKDIKDCAFFMESTLPFSISTPKITVLNPVAQKYTGFQTESVPTSTGQDDVRLLGLIWAILMDHQTVIFEQETTPNFPKGKCKMISQGIFTNYNGNYFALSNLEFKALDLSLA